MQPLQFNKMAVASTLKNLYIRQLLKYGSHDFIISCVIRLKNNRGSIKSIEVKDVIQVWDTI
jgi:hypothetical protein